LIESTARKIIVPGMIAVAGASVRKFWASNRSRPQVGTSGGNPRPRNERVDSAIIAEPTERVPATMIGLRVFGRMCLMIRQAPAPRQRAASTYSRSRWVTKPARTSRAVAIQFRPPITTTIIRKTPISGPKAATRALRYR
jgi:hypothetical protein